MESMLEEVCVWVVVVAKSAPLMVVLVPVVLLLPLLLLVFGVFGPAVGMVEVGPLLEVVVKSVRRTLGIGAAAVVVAVAVVVMLLGC
jgi:hypothetical protein